MPSDERVGHTLQSVNFSTHLDREVLDGLEVAIHVQDLLIAAAAVWTVAAWWTLGTGDVAAQKLAAGVAVRACAIGVWGWSKAWRSAGTPFELP